MQTFLPYFDYELSAQALDNQRLGKQRVEALQILRARDAIRRAPTWEVLRRIAWRNHPAVRMWKDHEGSLLFYTAVVCRVWRNRGFRGSVEGQLLSYLDFPIESFAPPEWLGDPRFHESHQSNLIRKDPEFYGPKFPDAPLNLPYVWPI